jgi:hypothetical protein
VGEKLGPNSRNRRYHGDTVRVSCSASVWPLGCNGSGEAELHAKLRMECEFFYRKASCYPAVLIEYYYVGIINVYPILCTAGGS